MFSIIHGINDIKDALSVADLGADCLGFSLDELNLEQINSIISQLPRDTTSIVTTHAYQVDDLEDQISHLQCQIIHLGTHPDKLSPKTVYRLKNEFSHFKFAQIIPVIDRYSLEIARRYENIADYIFLDSFNIQSRRLGVTGETHDWSISAEIVRSVSTPVILAGGLGPENITAAIKTVHPWGVATKTRTDLPDGSGKDLDKVRSFLSQTKNI